MEHLRSTILVGMLATALVVTALPMSGASAEPDAVCTNAPEGVFADVPTTSTHRANIDCIAAYGITVGVGGGNYDPGGHVPRQQMASFLVNFHEVATGIQHVPPDTSPFIDLTGTTHVDNIRIAAALELTRGRTPTTYAPLEPVTRAQMAAFVARLLRSVGADLPVPADRFRDDDGSVHERNIDALAAAGVVRGFGGDLYRPQKQVTRAQMATFLANAARLLDAQSKWSGPPLGVAEPGPTAVLVTASGETLDAIEIRWDRTVTSPAAAAGIEVADADDLAVVARGRTHVLLATDRTRVELDAPLIAAGTYWLRIPEGVASDVDGDTNGEQRIAFAFSPDPTDSGGSGGGGGGDDAVVVAPSILSVATDPALPRLVVTFDQVVTCPSSGAASWSFANDSIVGVASGSPTSTTQAAASTTCALVYDAVGDGDFGSIAYTQPAAVADRVTSAGGVPLASATNIRVSDSRPPEFTGVSALSDSSTLALSFSEPILCLSLHDSDFSVQAGPELADVSIVGFTCADASATPVIEVTPGSLVRTQSVTVNIVGAIFDASQDQQVPFGSRSSFIG